MADPRPLTRQELAQFLPNKRAIRAFEKLFDLIPPELEELLAAAEAASNNAELALGRTLKAFALINALDLSLKNFVFVSKLYDLPLPISGVITLRAQTTYYFTAEVDLLGNRLVGGQNTPILGASSENCKVKSTGLALGTALISSEWTMPIRHITFEAATIFNLDATANADQALDWYGVNLENTSDIGTIKNFNNFIVASMAFLSASGLVFDGTFGTIGFTDCLFSGTDPGTIIQIPATATISRRIRVSYSSIIAFGSGVGFDVSTSANIPVEGYIFDTCNFSGGGTYVSGVQHDDNKARWTENRGVKNSAALTGYYMQGNATATTIGAVSTPTKVAGTTTETTISQRFTVSTSNRATYDGAITRDFKVTAVCSLTSGNNNQIGVYVAKNGTELNESETYLTTDSGGRLENGAVQVLTELEDTNYIEIFVENNTAANNITVEDLNVIIEALN